MKLFKKKKQKKQLSNSLDDAKAKYAIELIDSVFVPVVKDNLAILNKALEKEGIKAGIEINWYFDKV